jgi:hypothetical protein
MEKHTMKKMFTLLTILFSINLTAQEKPYALLWKGDDGSELLVNNLVSNEHETITNNLKIGAQDGFDRTVYWYGTKVTISRESWEKDQKWREGYFSINRLDLTFSFNDQILSGGRWVSLHSTTGSCAKIESPKI